MKITVLFNRVKALPFGLPEEILADEDTVTTARAVTDALITLGHDATLWEVNEKTVSSLPKIPTEFFFNLAEGIGSLPDSEFKVVAVLEKIGKSFSGSGAKALRLTTDKGKTKKLLIKNNLPTPKYQIARSGDYLEFGLHFPVVAKPVAKDGSVGINGHSVLSRADELRDQVDFLKKTYQEPALVEEYIAGRELNVTVLGNEKTAQALPISEIIFGPSFKNKFKVVDFAAKWEEKSLNYQETVGVCPAKLAPKTRKRVEAVALGAFKVTGCRGYARIDLRLDKNEQPWILEVNANPGIGPSNGVIRSAKAAGYTYPGFLSRLLSLALMR